MTPGIVVAWIVVVGFAATLVITLLALIRVVQMESQYLSRLFKLLILELIGAAFWLLSLALEPPGEPPRVSFDPNVTTAEDVHLFNGTGEPLQKTTLKLGDKTVRTFNDTSPAFEIAREFEVRDGELLIKGGQQNTYQLGKIDVRDLVESEESFLSFRSHLNLGLHYAECLDDGICQQRRDARRAVRHLFAALVDESESDTHEEATLQLFHLKNRLQTCQDFGRLVNEIDKHRTIPYRYNELGDTYYALALYVDDLEPMERRAARELALKHFLRYLSLPEVRSGTALFDRANAQATEVATFLFDRAHETITALQSNEKRLLRIASDSLESTLQCAE